MFHKAQIFAILLFGFEMITGTVKQWNSCYDKSTDIQRSDDYAAVIDI